MTNKVKIKTLDGSWFITTTDEIEGNWPWVDATDVDEKTFFTVARQHIIFYTSA